MQQKIAICLFGYTGSTDNRENITSEFDPLYSFNINQNKFYKDYDIDFFIHSWSTNYKSKLIEFTIQRDYFEKQPNFLEIKLNDYNLDQIETYQGIIKKHNSNAINYLKNLIVASNSRWVSNCKAIKLMQNYKLNNNCNYDLVIQMRLDLIFCNKLNLNSLDKNIFYHPVRDNEKEIAINDYFFISNFENAISFSDIVNNLTQLSIRAPCAAKQFLDKLNIKHQEFLMFKKDFNILRIHKEKNISNSSIHTTKVKKK